jgi:hypothetical protein
MTDLLLKLTGLASARRYILRVRREHDLRLEFESMRGGDQRPLLAEPPQTVSPLVRRLYRGYRQWKFRRAIRRMAPLPRSFFESRS